MPTQTPTRQSRDGMIDHNWAKPSGWLRVADLGRVQSGGTMSEVFRFETTTWGCPQESSRVVGFFPSLAPHHILEAACQIFKRQTRLTQGGL